MRVIFSVNGIEYPHVVPRDLLFTSKYFASRKREPLGTRPSDLRITFNRRAVTGIWEYWVHKREIVSNIELMYRHRPRDARSTGQRILDDYLDLLACLCLAQVLGDAAFGNAVMAKLETMLRTNGHQNYFLACLTVKVVRDIFSLFGPASSVRALTSTPRSSSGMLEISGAS
jgi:hypothetical protein